MGLFDHSEYTPTVAYGPIAGEDCSMVFYRVCPKCGRFVKPDDKAAMPEYAGDKPNATCKKCGRVQMEFCTWYVKEGE
jgi:hypothetical protein